MFNQLMDAMQKYDHICPDFEFERCSLCQQRWEYEKRKLRNQKKRLAKLQQRRDEHFQFY